jgi:hypothetical protein
VLAYFHLLSHKIPVDRAVVPVLRGSNQQALAFNHTCVIENIVFLSITGKNRSFE